MLDENKIINLEKIKENIKKIFEEKWNDEFIVDAKNNRKITYSEFLLDINIIQQDFNKKGIKFGDTICTILENSLEFVKIYFAALIGNFTIVPIDPEKGKDEVCEIVNYVKPKKIIINKKEYDFSEKMMYIEEINFNNINHTKDNILSSLSNIDIERDFLITFTSGSTGKPKGVVHSVKNLILSAMAFNEKFNFDSKNVFLHNLPMSYMAGILNCIFLPFICKSKIVIDQRFSFRNAMNFWEIPKKYSVNVFWFTPTIIGLLLKFDRENEGTKFTKNNKIIGCVGTAALNNTIKKEFENKYDIKLYESYGLSEVLFVSTNSPNENNKEVGKILSDVKLNFREDEILIQVPWMFKKYQNLDKGEQMVEKYFISGDLGKISDNKILKITGRKKDLIIKGGVNISPKKIEDFIINDGYFEECVVIGFPDDVLGEKTICFISKQNKKNYFKKLNIKILENLGKDYHVDEFIELENIPKTTNGKVDKPKIKKMYSELQQF